ncbi:MAG: hypothetical protein ACQEVA_16820 [Myxococcota bacterium]
MTDTIQEVTHVAPSLIAEDLRQMGANAVVECPDILTHGPSTDDPKKHRKIRLKYWRKIYELVLPPDKHDHIDDALASFEGGYLSSEQLGSAAKHEAGDARVVVWTSPAWEDRLMLWMVFRGLLDQGVPASQIATAEMRAQVGEEEDDAFLSLRECGFDDLVAAFDDVFYPKEVYVEAGADLWSNFASASPRQWAIAIPHTTKFFPQMPHFAEQYGALFPNADYDNGRITLSEFDSALLASLDEARLQSALDVTGGELLEDFGFFDDLVFPARLREWALCDPDDPYVVEEAAPEADDVFEMFRFRITERGQELLADGAEPKRRLPMLQIGDSRLYAGKEPWVRVVEDDVWFFERYGSRVE